MATISLNELKNISLEELLTRVAREQKSLTIRLSETETITLQPGHETEDAYWQQLMDLGLVNEKVSPTLSGITYQPIITSESISETILRERR